MTWRVWFKEMDGYLRPFYYDSAAKCVEQCSMGISAYMIEQRIGDTWVAVDPRTLGKYKETSVPDVFLKCE